MDEPSGTAITLAEQIIESTNFKVTKWQTVADNNYDMLYKKRVEENNVYALNLEDLKIKGIEVILTK